MGVDISIIIPTHNNVHFTERCIWSLFHHLQNTRYSYEIIVVNNRSVDGVHEMLQKYQWAVRELIINDRANFSQLNNQAAKMARGQYLLFLNNDTEIVHDGVIDMLISNYKDPTVGIVGVRQLYPHNRRIHHAGIVVDRNLSPTHLYPDMPEWFPGANKRRDFMMVSGACIIIPKQLFLDIGMFDEKYIFGYEDCDLCLKVKELGYRVVYDPKITILHFGQGSGSRAHLDKHNKDRFSLKWKHYLRSDIDRYYREDNYYFYNRISRLYLKTVTATRKVAHWLDRDTDCDVLHIDILDENSSFDQINRTVYDQLTSLDSVSVKKFNRKAAKSYPYKSIYALSWSHYWNRYSTQRPDNVKYLDLFAVNYQISNKDLLIDPWTSYLPASDSEFLPISSFCADYLAQVGVPKKKIHPISLGYSKEIENFVAKIKESVNPRIRVLSVINSHDLERNGADLIFHLIRSLPLTYQDKVQFYIKDYGQGATQNRITQYIEEVRKSGWDIVYDYSFTSKEKLIAIYCSADLFLAPFRGEGFGMKILDAMACGLPVIAPFYGGITDYAKFGLLLKIDHTISEMRKGYDCKSWPMYGLSWCEPTLESLERVFIDGLYNIKKYKKLAYEKSGSVRNKFSWENTAQQIQTVYRKVSSQPRISVNSRAKLDITVLCNTYNGAKKLVKMIPLYLEQDIPYKWELLLVDDGSQDNTEQISRDFSKNAPIRYIKSQHVGTSEIKNVGIRNAEGSIILFVGDDILPCENFVKKHVEFHQSHPGKEHMVLGHTEWAASIRNNPILEYATKIGGTQFSYEGFRNMRDIDYRFTYTSNLSLKKDFIFRTNTFFNKAFTLPMYEDTEWGYRLYSNGAKIIYDRKIEALHEHNYSLEQFSQRQIMIGRTGWLARSLCYPLEKYINSEYALSLYQKYNSEEFIHNNNILIKKEIENMKELVKLRMQEIEHMKSSEMNYQLYSHKTQAFYHDIHILAELSQLYGLTQLIAPIMDPQWQKELLLYVYSKPFTRISPNVAYWKNRIKSNTLLYNMLKPLKDRYFR